MLHVRKLTVLFVVTSSCSWSVGNDAFKPPIIEVPEGYTVELAAASPLVKHPIMANFDDRGRLFVAGNAGQNLRRADLEKTLPNFIRLLEDTDGDGRFDKSTVFADKMTFPQGVLWHDGALYVASSGAIWKLEDTDGDDVADRRTKLVSDFGYTGNAADVHGPFLGPEGRIYWCEGRHGHEIKTADGKVISQGKAARIFSCWPDGSDVQTHCGGGMDNPVEIDFTAEGEMFGTVNIMYRQRGDCLVHWLRGGVYPRHDQQHVVDEFKRTGNLLKEAYNFGHVAVSGTTRYRSTQLAEEFRDNFFVCEFNTHKVSRLSLHPEGSTYRGEKHEFLVSTNNDFHPTDVLEDADGSLLIVDTGGWFRIGCPTSQIAKPNILGAIYRVRRKDAAQLDDPRGLKIDWEEVEPLSLLDDPRFVVRQRAVMEYGKREGKVSAIPKLSPRGRCHLAWAFVQYVNTTESTPDSSFSMVLCSLLRDEDASVRLAAANAIGALRPGALDSLYAGTPETAEVLKTGAPPLRRAFATALGRNGNSGPVRLLLDALGTEVDRPLEHALIYALIEIADRDETAKGLSDPDPRVRRGALIALDQMDDGNLTRNMVASLLETDDFALRQSALDVISRRPEWADDVVDTLQQLIAKADENDAVRAVIRGSVLAFCHNDKVRSLVADSLGRDSTPEAAKLLLLDTMGRCDFQAFPRVWLLHVAKSMYSENLAEVRQAMVTAAATGDERFIEYLLRAGDNDSLPEADRIAAICSASKLGAKLNSEHLRRLLRQVSEEVSPMLRLQVARAIGSSQHADEDLLLVAAAVERAGPLELAPLLGAFSRTTNASVGVRLVQALAESPGFASLSATQVEELLAGFPKKVQEGAKPLLDKLSVGSADWARRLDDLQSKLAKGDAERGKSIFMSTRTSCVACHRVDEIGGRIGPDLSDVGARRGRRDLLEAILFPNASFVRGFETFTLSTREGSVHSGVIVRETAQAVHLRTTDQTEIRVRRDAIDQMRPSRTSIMPSGLDKTMTESQLADLLAYLQSLK